LSMADAREKINERKVDYNLNHPHTSLGNLTPMQFAEQSNQVRRVA
jgi:putative transposase